MNKAKSPKLYAALLAGMLAAILGRDGLPVQIGG